MHNGQLDRGKLLLSQPSVNNGVTLEHKTIHTPSLHSNLGCLLFYMGSSNSGTRLSPRFQVAGKIKQVGGELNG